MSYIPLNGSAVTDKVRRGLTGNPARVETAATTLGAALRGDPDYQVTGTGFGLNDDDTPETTKAPATDPSQGRTGRAKPVDNRDPLLVAFKHVLNF